jgi:hypothetical protein
MLKAAPRAFQPSKLSALFISFQASSPVRMTRLSATRQRLRAPLARRRCRQDRSPARLAAAILVFEFVSPQPLKGQRRRALTDADTTGVSKTGCSPSAAWPLVYGGMRGGSRIAPSRNYNICGIAHRARASHRVCRRHKKLASRMSTILPKADIHRARRDVRFVPKADIQRCGKRCCYSITSSARATSVGGMVRPRAVAVLRLMTSSIFVGCSTGKSAGCAPFRILST